MEQVDIKAFSKIIDSLKKYRRAEIKSENGSNLSAQLYVDLLPQDHILETCLKENTTFLIGRKGTGKSTIFLKLEDELKKQNRVFPCYIDIKTIYDSCKPTSSFIESSGSQYLDIYKRYLWEAGFIKAVITSILDKIDTGFIKGNFFQKFFLGEDKKTRIKQELKSLNAQLLRKDSFSTIELPQFEKYIQSIKTKTDLSHSTEQGLKLQGGNTGLTGEIHATDKKSSSLSQEEEGSISTLLLEHFDIQLFIEKIKKILQIAEFDTIYILLDDFSEIDDTSIKYFTDIVLAPLNNRSEEFIKFKIASYPSRTYFGAIDPIKVDQIDLDFFKLYESHNKGRMEELAIDFTSRLLQKRSQIFLKTKDISIFFDTSKIGMEEYYKLLFQVSFNVPRILGYILSHCHEGATIHHQLITKKVIDNAAQRYYENTLTNFFKETTYSTCSLDEKITVLQLSELLNVIIQKSRDIKTQILKDELKGANYSKAFPASSHFHVQPEYEIFLQTLELNFFINKYIEYKDRDKNEISVYSLNYGLCQKFDIIYGVPKDGKTNERKYLIERPFNFSSIVANYINGLKIIECNKCSQKYSEEELKFLEYYKYQCKNPECNGLVETKPIDGKFRKIIDAIPADSLFQKDELSILMELNNTKNASAKDIAEAIDISSYSIGQRAIKLDEQYKLIKREKEKGNYLYNLTKQGENFIHQIKLDE
ncbi:UNVERIFIED_CONTAM: MarR family transcriptional regulator [Acinetobacter sp. HSTU-ASm16]